MNLVAIDPGVKTVGWAFFMDNVLVDCNITRSKNGLMHEHADDYNKKFPPRDDIVASHGIIEVPQIYQQRLWKGRQEDLVNVIYMAGSIAGVIYQLSHVELRTVKPHEWKKNVKKDIHNKRIISRLNTEELDIFNACDAPKSLRHNVIDAIGVGLYALKRDKKK